MAHVSKFDEEVVFVIFEHIARDVRVLFVNTNLHKKKFIEFSKSIAFSLILNEFSMHHSIVYFIRVVFLLMQNPILFSKYANTYLLQTLTIAIY